MVTKECPTRKTIRRGSSPRVAGGLILRLRSNRLLAQEHA